MKCRMYRYVLFLFLVAALVVSTDEGVRTSGAATPRATPAQAATPGASEVSDQADLVAALRDKGLKVDEVESLKPTVPFLGAQTGTLLRFSGDELDQPIELQVYDYADAATAAADAGQILPDGNLETTMIEWLAPPHFFGAGRVLVLYLGSDQRVLDLLTAVLGPQFAGR
jgi:hypothetical protein